MSYEDTIQAIARELRDAFPNDPRATQQTSPKRHRRRKRTTAELGPLALAQRNIDHHFLGCCSDRVVREVSDFGGMFAIASVAPHRVDRREAAVDKALGVERDFPGNLETLVLLHS